MGDVIDLSKFNETDIREEILSPLLRSLGYRTGGTHSIERERLLKYEHNQLGRKKPTDPVLKGKVDYVLTAGGRVRWVIEAKAPSVEISWEDIAQAFTYARHPEINAVFYVVCNGHYLNVYQTINVPEAALIRSIAFDQYADPDKKALFGHFDPDSIMRAFPAVYFEPGQPLGEGLRSAERIISGSIRYSTDDQRFKIFSQHIISIVGGDVQRDGKQLVARMETRAPIVAIQTVMEQMNLTNIELRCNDQILSTNVEKPSVFTYVGAIIFPAGSTLFDLNSWRDITLPVDLRSSVKWTASGYLIGRKFLSTVVNEMHIEGPDGLSMQMDITGQAELIFG